MERIDLLIQICAWRARSRAGLALSEEAVTMLLKQPRGLPAWVEDSASVVAQLAALEDQIAGQRAASLAAGVPLRLVNLAILFDLSLFDLDVLLIALAPELEPRYSAIFAELQSETHNAGPSVDLILNLTSPTFESKLSVRQRFEPEAPLLRHHLIEITDPPLLGRSPLLTRTVRLDPRICAYLLDLDGLDDRLQIMAELTQPVTQMDELIQPQDMQARLTRLVSANRQIMLYFQGREGVGKQATAEMLCGILGHRLIVFNSRLLTTSAIDEFIKVLGLAKRDGMLMHAALYWHDFDVMFTPEHRDRLELFLREMGSFAGIVFIAGESHWELSHDAVPLFIQTPFPLPTYEERLQIWESLADLPSIDWRDIANKFKFTGGQIRDSLATARNLAQARGTAIVIGDIYAACRIQSNRNLTTLARKVKISHTWDDIVLPDEQKQVLWEIYNQMRYRAQVYYDWGFDAQFSMGKGLSALFSGPSGTGKTLAAEILAGGLGLELYKIDLSSIVSKYIGETEKHLAQIFTEAETSNAILFFDEADALFGKRSEVSDSHDRYANIQVSYLLQRMEEYDGVVILTTNLRKNMDEAFVRRMGFILEFPFPTVAYRRQIWGQVWPKHTPISPTVDFDLMASRFELAGGNIRNIALAAAFLAADDGQVVTMAHLMRATRREYQKIGKIIAGTEFGI
jgi:ATP-dependent 26S proteasome regulatory subunit